MPRQTRYAIKQFLNNAQNNLLKAMAQIKAVIDIYHANEAPEYAEPLEAALFALSEVLELLSEREQAA